MGLGRKFVPMIVLGCFVFVMVWTGGPNSDSEVFFDAKTIELSPTANGSLRVTEYVDINFGRSQKHGYRRYVRTDFGYPENVIAASPSMSSELYVGFSNGFYEMRIGDPNATDNGQHRFVLSYTLPDAYLDGYLNYSLIDPDEDPITHRFRVILNGFRLDNSLCSVGDWGTVGGCELVDGPFGQEVVLEPLDRNEGLNLSGFAMITGEVNDIGDVHLPVQESTPLNWLWPLIGALAVIVGSALVMRWSLWRGKNSVGALDPAGAAHPVGGSPVHRVTDEELRAMTTVEFAAPKGIAPWEGNILLVEHIGWDIQTDWLSSLIGEGLISLDLSGSGVLLRLEVARNELSDFDRQLVDVLLPGGATERRISDKYDRAFHKQWNAIRKALRDKVASAGWWEHSTRRLRPPMNAAGAWFLMVLYALFIVFVDAVVNEVDALQVFESSSGKTVYLTLLSFAFAYFLMRGERASRTVVGSSLYLQTASFGRFLEQSEGRHVEEAYRLGVLREYSAWAVVLGHSRAWKKAVRAVGNSAIDDSVALTMASLSATSAVRSSAQPPASNSNGGGSGGGGSGGGGGGGGSGGW